MVSVDRLKARLSRTLKARKLDAALETITALTAAEPKNPSWPKRAARLLHVMQDQAGELQALHRALALEVEGGLVLDAIASCKAILEIDPKDEQSRDCLDRLHPNRAAQDGGPVDGSRAPRHPARRRKKKTKKKIRRKKGRNAPLESLELNRILPDARPVMMGDAAPGGVHEIPVDANSASSDSKVPDLRLDTLPAASDLGDLAAAQAASLPSREDLERTHSGLGAEADALRLELANVPLFGDLDPASLHTLIRRVRVVRLAAGQILFREGDPANSLYVVVEGAVVPIAEGERRRKLAVLERGEFFGEIGVLTKQPRNATVEGLVDSQLLAIDRRVLWELIDKQPSVAKSILRFLRARLIDRQIRTNLFFAAFAHGEREEVARQFRVLEVADGSRIVEQGQPPEGLFVVLSGRLDRYDRKREKSVGELGIGDVFGGLSLVEGRASATDLVALGKCWLVVLGESRFRKILEANPRLERVLRRIENVDSQRDESESVAAV